MNARLSTPSFSALRFSLALLLASLIAAPRTQAAVLDPLAEYRIKAAYLYNFTKFVEWPPAPYLEARSSFVIGVLERDATVSSAIAEVLRGKTTSNGRAIELKMAQDVAALGGCQIIFVTRSANASPSSVRSSISGPVLLVGETPDFAQTGGTINFMISGDSIRLEINAQRAERVGLHLSGTLASIALLVRDRETKP